MGGRVPPYRQRARRRLGLDHPLHRTRRRPAQLLGLGSHERGARKPSAARPRHVRARLSPRLRRGRGPIHRRLHAERQLGRGEPPARRGHLAAKGRARRAGVHMEPWMRTRSELFALVTCLTLVGTARADEQGLRRTAALGATPVSAAGAGSAKSALDTAQIEQLTGAKGQLDEKEGVFKVSVPRTDLQPTTAGVKIPTSMGLTSWAAFQRSPGHTMVMGDLVFAEDQVNPVMSVALDSGLEVTALHNHFFWESPRVMFLHVAGMGSLKALAAAVGKVFAKMKETAGGTGESPKVQVDPAQTSVDGSKIDAVLGVKGKVDGGIYKTTIGRTTHMHGTEA